MGVVLFSQTALAAETDMSTQAIEKQIKPIGQVQIGAPTKPVATPAPTTAATPATVPTPAATTTTAPITTQAGTPQGVATQATNEGEKVYKTYCIACHAAGLAGAPKFGDVAEWAPRIHQGMSTLVSHAVNGYKVMPPKGTCVSCSNDQIAAAVKYMVSNSQKK